MAIDINLLSLNSDGALRTMMHKRMPHMRKMTSTRKKIIINKTFKDIPCVFTNSYIILF